MIMKRTTHALLAFMAAVLLCFGLAGAAFAATDSSEVSLAQEGNEVHVTLSGGNADVSAFSLVLDVEPDVPDAVQVGFHFSDAINERTSIHEAKLSTVGDKTRVALYVAGGNDLFAEPLAVGDLALALDTEASSGAAVVISVPEVDDETDANRESVYALRTVSGSYGEDAGGVYLNTGDTDETGVFTAHLGDRATSGDNNGGNNGGDNNGGTNGGGNGGNNNGGNGGTGGTGNGTGGSAGTNNGGVGNGGADGAGDGSGIKGGNYTGMSPDDGYGPVDATRNNTNVGGEALSQTGDTLLPVVVTLLCVIALAACAMAFIVIRRRKQH